jgi:hypothetical protein
MKRLRHRIHQRLGTAGLIIAVAALALALTGAAIAAGGALSAKQTKEVTKIAKKYAGKPGASGAQGPAGPAGANGKDGVSGAPGANGKSVTVTEIPTGEATECEERGGAMVAEEGAVSGTEVCNGSPWAVGTLPTGATEAGVWIVVAGNVAPISFPVPLSAGIAENHVKKVAEGVTPPAECDNAEGAAASPANPEADPGFLCIFVGEGSVPVVAFDPGGSGLAAGRAGAVLGFTANGSSGTFAVTGS